MRSIRKIHEAEYRPIQDLITYSPLPSRCLEHLDPFLFLNHHGPQDYPPHNNGLPFGPHPHRGMETVTFILSGDITHQDSGGHKSVIEAGGIQWMTAGRGLIHSEISSDEFKEKGGHLEILQLWLNLPSKLKMTEPAYHGKQASEIPLFDIEQGARMQLISGDFNGHSGAFKSITDVFLSTIAFEPTSQTTFKVPLNHTVFLYIINGELEVQNQKLSGRKLIEFAQDHEEIKLKATKDSRVIFGHGLPFQEPIVASGPFVMNSMQEIQEAYADYQAGKFGQWTH